VKAGIPASIDLMKSLLGKDVFDIAPPHSNNSLALISGSFQAYRKGIPKSKITFEGKHPHGHDELDSMCDIECSECVMEKTPI
jgi:hypothetical protein